MSYSQIAEATSLTLSNTVTYEPEMLRPDSTLVQLLCYPMFSIFPVFTCTTLCNLEERGGEDLDLNPRQRVRRYVNPMPVLQRQLKHHSMCHWFNGRLENHVSETAALRTIRSLVARLDAPRCTTSVRELSLNETLSSPYPSSAHVVLAFRGVHVLLQHEQYESGCE